MVFCRVEINFNFKIVLLETKRIDLYRLFDIMKEKIKGFKVPQTRSFYLF